MKLVEIKTPPVKATGVVLELSIDELIAIRNAMGQMSFSRLNNYHNKLTGIPRCDISSIEYDELWTSLRELAQKHG